MKRLTLCLLALSVLLAGCIATPIATPIPTATPPAATARPRPPTATAPPPTSQGLEAPKDLAALEPWLVAAWNENLPAGRVQAALQAAGWQRDSGDWHGADLDGDGREEWLITLIDPAGEAAPRGPTGCLWVVSARGIAFRLDAQASQFYAAPVVPFVADLTDDGRPDAVTQMQGCGASTCTFGYLVISAHGGAIRNMVQGSEVLPGTSGIVMTTVSATRLTADKPPRLVLTGGTYGSVGAGITRERTETWGWDGQAVTLQETVWAASDYIHHVLYDGNLAFDAEDEPAAVAAYLRVIEDETLKDAVGMRAGESARDAARQFAGFRMVLLNLRALAEVEAYNWSDWLTENYPGAALTRAAKTLLRQWSETNDLAAACAVVIAQLEGETDPTGPLADMGYGNPSLGAADVCGIR